MALRRTSLELSVERELPGEPPTRARLSAQFSVEPGAEPSTEELATALASLRADLDRSLGVTPAPPRGERSLEELVETYRPRQSELVDLLREEGELTAAEHTALRAYLAHPESDRSTGGPPELLPANLPLPANVAAPAPEPGGRPLAAAPLAHDRAPDLPRPVPELLQRYQITSLRQAGAVRARRQISYEEYMALKRHFDAPAAGTASAPAGQ